MQAAGVELVEKTVNEAAFLSNGAVSWPLWALIGCGELAMLAL